jgi:hypothetical protein
MDYDQWWVLNLVIFGIKIQGLWLICASYVRRIKEVVKNMGLHEYGFSLVEKGGQRQGGGRAD